MQGKSFRMLCRGALDATVLVLIALLYRANTGEVLLNRSAEAAGFCEYCQAKGSCPTAHAALGCSGCSGTYGLCAFGGLFCTGGNQCPGFDSLGIPCFCVPFAMYNSCGA